MTTVNPKPKPKRLALRDRPGYDLRIVPLGTGDHIRRLRRLLKTMLRGYGFKCVTIAEAKGKDDPNAEH